MKELSEPECPDCGTIMEIVEDYDHEFQDQEAWVELEFYCPKCEEFHMLNMVYKFDHYENYESTEE